MYKEELFQRIKIYCKLLVKSSWITARGRNMIYRLLAMNIDGTILQSNHRLNKSVKEAVDYVQAKGVKVTLVTSRNFIFAKRIAKALKLNSMIVAHHGALLVHRLMSRNLSSESHKIRLMISCFLESFPCHIRVITEKFSVSNIPLKKFRQTVDY